jgi:general L-amino acid transport system substrate-binding protein
MRFRARLLAALMLVSTLLWSGLGVGPARSGDVLDRVRSQGVLRCGGEPRPGLLTIEAAGQASGLLLDLCGAVAAAVLKPPRRLELHAYDSARAYDAVRDGTDDLFFLTGSQIVDQRLAGKVVPGPAVFYQTTAVMVAESSPARRLADLAGQPICFAQGSNAQRHLEAWFAAHALPFMRMGYQEDVEMDDAYNVQVCHGLAGEVTTLAQVRRDGGVNGLRSRILAEPLAAFPIVAATGTTDAAWSAVVAWSIHTLMRAEVPTADWAAGGLQSLPIAAPELGLDPGWQQRVVEAAGSYGEIYRRNLGGGSPYGLPRGLNALWQDGGLMISPYAE